MSIVLGLGLVALLMVAVVPAPRVHRMLLTGLNRLVQAASLAFLGACGTFFIKPEAAPDWLRHTAQPLLEHTVGTWPDPGSGWPWLVVAALVVGVALPMMLLVELAINLSRMTSLVEGLRKEIRHAATWLDCRLAAFGASGLSYQSMPSETAAASAALRGAGQSTTPKPVDPTPLVLDLIK